MDDLSKALGDISSIRQQMARTTEFRGYGPATLATTGALALGAAVLQSLFIPEPARHPNQYLALWVLTALVCATITAIQVVTRTRRLHSGLSNEMLRMAIEQFLPALLAGTLATAVVAWTVPAITWTLPGLWQIIFSLGIFASCRFLPRPMLAAGCWYLASGLLTLHLGDSRALSPWTMGLSFGLGELLIAAALLSSAPEEA
jgi:hypothetical protein